MKSARNSNVGERLVFNTALLIFFSFIFFVSADNFERELYSQLLSTYNPLVRPVINSSSPIEVKMKLVLNQIVDVDEKSQTVRLALWHQHEWYDEYLIWNITQFGGISDVRLPSGTIWRPDTLLYNSADAEFEATQLTNFVVYHDGLVSWLPPTIVTFSCRIHTAWFPFDDQHCFLKFGSWTYNGYKLNLEKMDEGWDISEYIPNGEWELMSFNVVRTVKIYECCPEPYPDLKFHLHIRRRALYYGFNIIMPSMLVGATTVLGFALPIESGEKITLEITILLSICVFLGMLANMVPSTSDALPLICIYFAGNMYIICLSVLANVLVLNLRYRASETHVMGKRMRKIMLDWLPWLLMMNRPGHQFSRPKPSQPPPVNGRQKNEIKLSDYGDFITRRASTQTASSLNNFLPGSSEEVIRVMAQLMADTHKHIAKITGRIRNEDEKTEAMQSWRFAAIVFDRLCLCIFTIFLLTFMCLTFAAPHYVDVVY